MAYIDIRDIIARIEELEGEQESFVIGAPDGTETPAPDQWAEENSDDAAGVGVMMPGWSPRFEVKPGAYPREVLV